MSPLSRRQLCADALVLAAAPAVLASTSGVASAAPSPLAAPPFARTFASPPAEARPKIRYWWPCADIDPEAIAPEIRAMAEQGFGAAEIQCMFAFTDPRTAGWGSPALTARLQQAVEAGQQHGVRIDITVGPAWPLVVPGVTPDSREAAQEIVYGRTQVEGGATYSGPVPAGPAPHSGVTRQTLVAVHAVRHVGSPTAKPVRLERQSLVDLTGSVREGNLSWTAPSGGNWLLIGYWQRGTGQASVTGQAVSGEAAYVVDHFSPAGTDAATGYWDTHILTPALRRLLKTNGGDLFEDSLELDSAQHWTPGLPDRFHSLCGYSLLPHLPVLFIDRIHRQYTPVTVDDTPDFEFTDLSGARVRDDYYRTLTDLYVTEHVQPLKTWAHSLGLRLRAQPYGTTFDSSTVAAALDVPETETLGDTADYTDPPSRWMFIGAAHLAARNVVSLEGCATFGSAYAQTWPQMLKHFNAAFAHGVNQVVFHGFATDRTAANLPWPGFSPFTLQGGNGFSEAWGPRQPTWRDTGNITAWTARMQHVLRQGSPVVDLVVYRQRYDASLQVPDALAGFTFDFAGPDQLAGTRVKGRRLASDGPAYRALILDSQTPLPVRTARLLLTHAREGLPVVVIGAPPVRTPGAFRPAEQDAELARLVKLLLAQPSVRRVTTSAELPGALKKLGVRASAETAGTGLLTVRRAQSGRDFYYVHNPTSAPVSSEISLEGGGQPYMLDAWTGRTTPLGQYRSERSRVTVPLALPAGATAVIALDRTARPGRHVTDADGGEIVTVGGVRHLRATTSGASTVTWNSGKKTEVVVPKVAARQTLDSWQLSVEDWHRGTDGQREITHHELALDRLKPWTDIPKLRDVAGIGTYTTTVRLDHLDGAYLDLGEVTDTFEVTVNGRALPPADQVTRRIDLGSFVKPGRNTLTVRVATPLRNRLRVTDGYPGQAEQPRQQYGLIGPVRLTPYRQVPVRN
ncbi:glycosyl hydrolase [Streptomyces olindensis]|uniref:glycosyl hydrolase n=1 Tax=Streptomyces olindensis TaxID=358823 RepID=UPI0033E6AE22